MEQFIRILKKIFCLPPLPSVVIAFVGYALIIFVAAFHINIMAIQYLAYIGSAYALVFRHSLPFVMVYFTGNLLCIACSYAFAAFASEKKENGQKSNGNRVLSLPHVWNYVTYHESGTIFFLLYYYSGYKSC